MTIISVGRDGQELGDYRLESIQEGLASGYFSPGDFGWYEGLPEWLSLSQIVAQLTPPPVPVDSAAPSPPPTPANSPPPFFSAPTFNQNLKPVKGEVTYVLKESRKGRKKKVEKAVHIWQGDAATDKQIAFLKGLGMKNIPANLTKGDAHNQIDALLARGQAHNFLSPKQRACLHYYGIDAEKLKFDEAMVWLDRVHEKPESFNVPEPWETAKYRLYPSLYPSSEKTATKGCAVLIVVILVCTVGLCIVIMSH